MEIYTSRHDTLPIKYIPALFGNGGAFWGVVIRCVLPQRTTEANTSHWFTYKNLIAAYGGNEEYCFACPSTGRLPVHGEVIHPEAGYLDAWAMLKKVLYYREKNLLISKKASWIAGEKDFAAIGWYLRSRTSK